MGDKLHTADARVTSLKNIRVTRRFVNGACATVEPTVCDGPKRPGKRGSVTVGFIEAVKTCFSKFATFEGRARRAEYWMFYLFLNLVSFAGLLLSMLAGGIGVAFA